MTYRSRVFRVVTLVSVLFMAAVAQADDKAVLDKTEVIGNRELPKVLYIVPWKQPNAVKHIDKAGHGLLDAQVQAVDRDSFRRVVTYLAQTQSTNRSATESTERNLLK